MGGYGDEAFCDRQNAVLIVLFKCPILAFTWPGRSNPVIVILSEKPLPKRVNEPALPSVQ